MLINFKFFSLFFFLFLSLFRDFCKAKMDQIVERVGLPKQVQNSMNGFLEGEAGDINALINLLNQEESLQSSFLKIIEELVLFGIHEGIRNL